MDNQQPKPSNFFCCIFIWTRRLERRGSSLSCVVSSGSGSQTDKDKVGTMGRNPTSALRGLNHGRPRVEMLDICIFWPTSYLFEHWKRKNQKVVRVRRLSPWPSPLQRFVLYHRGLAFLPPCNCNEYHIMAKPKLINKNKNNNMTLLRFGKGRGHSEFIAHPPTFHRFVFLQPLWLRRGGPRHHKQPAVHAQLSNQEPLYYFMPFCKLWQQNWESDGAPRCWYNKEQMSWPLHWSKPRIRMNSSAPKLKGRCKREAIKGSKSPKKKCLRGLWTSFQSNNL